VHVDVEYDPPVWRWKDLRRGTWYRDPLVFGPYDRTERHVVDVQLASLTGA